MNQKLFTFALVLLLGSITANATNTTRYWDSCKPSCAWTGNAGGSPNGVATSCNINGAQLGNSANAVNACDGGESYTCMGQVPWAVNDNLAYGFAASHSNGDCGKCFELTFTDNGQGGTTGGNISGKKMVVMISNIGGDVGGDQLDLMIPGGGVGIYNALTKQIQQNGGPQSPQLGDQYGGFRSPNNGGCGNNATCVQNMCNAAFNSAGLAKLKAGCQWFIDWFKIANNPQATKTVVDCPEALKNAYKTGNGGGGGTSSNSTASSSSAAPPTYTLTVNRNPNNVGSTSPTSQSGITAGQQVSISATPSGNYVFQNWTVTSGSPNISQPQSATTTVTLSANATITANFIQQTAQGYTLTASVYPSGSGTVSPTSQSNVTSTTITATANAGYTFQGWVVVNGTTATFANANSQTTTVTLSANATIRANFTQNAVSSSGGSQSSSSSLAGGFGNCIPPPGNVVPPNGIETCIVVNGKCYICNQDRGQDCSSTWLWTGGQVAETYWFTQVSCPTGGSSSSAAASSSSAASSVNWNGVGVLRIEAENYVSKVGANMVTVTAPNNGLAIGYIENNYSTTYKVNMSAAGTFPMAFSIATGQTSNFTVRVNGTQVGTTVTKTGSAWDDYSIVNLSSNVSLNSGENTIELRFQGAVNVDYLQLGTPPASSSSGGSSSSGTTPVILPQIAYSNVAQIQANGIYLQVMNNAKLELFDLRGKSVRKMNFSSGVHSVRLNDLPRGLYIARVSFGSERKILRIPIR